MRPVSLALMRGNASNGVVWANVVVLLHLNATIGGGTTVDSQGRSWPTGLSGGNIEATSAKFGAAGWKGIGIYSRLRLNHASHHLGSSDFTIEAWAKINSTSGNRCILSRSNNGAPTIEWRLYSDGTNSMKVTFVGTFNGALITLVGPSLTVGTYTHVAVCRSGGTVRLFIDGVKYDEAIVSGSLYDENTYTGIGGLYDDVSGWIWDGHIDEVRISKQAVYTADFTPSASEFPDS